MKTKSSLKILFISGLFAASATLSLAAPSRPSTTPEAPAGMRHFEAGTKHLLEGRGTPAERRLRRAISANEEFAEAHTNLAFILRKRGEEFFEEALEHYNRAIELNAELAEAYMYRGVLYIQMGEMELAEADHAVLKELNEDLATELAWVMQHGEEREPEHFFGVVQKIDKD